ncbi:hypothetical protein [Burkholderia ambifaria]|uniref:hypothetical protein n=1 Tax=Burkholderia ambifaria TaxID=152480 RepID=UPI00158C52E7|nr:hypothetical protein [Burkholderia ambifaria]
MNDSTGMTTRGYIDEDLKRVYDVYVDHQMRGCTPVEAALRVHILDEHVAKWVRAAESDPYVIERKRAALKALDVNTAWSAETSIIHLLRLVENPYEKGSVKLGAIDRLNVLLGITEVDRDGNTRLGRGPSVDELLRMTPDANGASERKVH